MMRALEHHPEALQRGLQREVALAPRSSLKVGGTAEYFVAPETPERAIWWLQEAERLSCPVTILGGGSNVLIADQGIAGLVLHPRWEYLEERSSEESQRSQARRLRVGAGYAWDALVEYSTEQGWSGLECLAGIPGQLGAAPIQNIGAYGASFSESCIAVEVYDRGRRERRWLSNESCVFRYRDSLFKRDPSRYLILSAELELSVAPPTAPRYPQLRDRLEESGAASHPSAKELRTAVLEIRREKGMTLDQPTCPDRRSAGSLIPSSLQNMQRRLRCGLADAGPGGRFHAGLMRLDR